MGKLDKSLARIHAHEKASSQPAENDLIQPLKVSPNLSKGTISSSSFQEGKEDTNFHVSQNRRENEFREAEKASSLSKSSLPEEKDKSSEPFSPSSSIAESLSPGVSVTRYRDVKEGMKRLPVFNWHPKVDVCRTQTNSFEEFKKLRTHLINLVDKKGFKTFMVTSCKHAEGKTTTALAVARSIGEYGRRVCLVDGDMRRPRIKNFLGIKVEKGLDDVILDKEDLATTLIYSEEDNLAVLPTRKGRSTASELLGSKEMGAVIRSLSRDFDILIFDSPPCLSTTDPIILGMKMDAVSLVVKMNHTPRQSVEHSITLMRQSEIPFIGLILTHHVVHYNTYLLQKYHYYQDYYGYYAYQDAEKAQE
jgi:capsular exopolysaccharide synthesis family protein